MPKGMCVMYSKESLEDNKKILYPILDEVELFKKGLEKMLIFKNIIFKKNRNNTWKREICENRGVEFIISPLKQQIYP